MQIEVNHISKRDFLIKLFCDQKQGGFARLMKAINFLDLQVVDANVTTFNGKVLNILRVEVRLIAMNRIRCLLFFKYRIVQCRSLDLRSIYI